MNEISSGLQLYSTIKNSFSVIILCYCCLCATYGNYHIYNKNYIQANNSEITFKHVKNNIPIDNCSVNAPETDCLYVSEYDDIQNNHFAIPNYFTDGKKPPQIGKTNIFYEDKNPQNYVSSYTHPSNIVLIILIVIILLLIISSIHLYFIISN